MENCLLENKECVSESDSDDDEIQVFSKSMSEENVKCIMEDVIEVVVERGIPCEYINHTDNLNERVLEEDAIVIADQTPTQNLMESMPYIFLVVSIVLAVFGHYILGSFALILIGFLKVFPDQKPGQKAHPSDQKTDLTCTVHALGKAIVDGFHDGLFCEGVRVNFKQSTVIETLKSLQIDKKKPKYPTDFTQRRFFFLDIDTERYYTIVLHVQRVGRDKVIEDMDGPSLPKFKYLLSYCKPTWLQRIMEYKLFAGPAHCVFVRTLTPADDNNPYVANCVNSYGDLNDPFPGIRVDQKYNQFYQVNCVVLSTAQIVHDVFRGGDKVELMEID